MPYKLATVNDVIAKLDGATNFRMLDITHAYWTIKLDEDSSMLTTFSILFG